MGKFEHHFPCDACGADLTFDPSAGHLKCGHCNAQIEIGSPQGRLVENDIRPALTASAQQPSTPQAQQVSHCPNCTAEIRIEHGEHATRCAYCDTPVVLESQPSQLLKPAGVLPFRIPQRSAHAALAKWLASRWFAPSALKKSAQKGRAMRGVYTPYWTFDAQTDSQYRGMRGTAHYRSHTVMRDGEPRRVRKREVHWRRASGRVSRHFDDVLILASNSLPRRIGEQLRGWRLEEAEPYQPAYLAGFEAEAYQVPLDEGLSLAQRVMEAQITKDVRRDIGGDEQRIEDVRTTYSRVTYKHLLLPIWVTSYRYRGKIFHIVINGQTGEVEGERPYSVIKIGLLVLAAVCLMGGVIYLRHSGHI